MASTWTIRFSGRCCSIYSLNENDGSWIQEGTNGQLTVYQNDQNHDDIRMKWYKTNQNQEIWWRFFTMHPNLKRKGERALVLRAWRISLNRAQILAIRFATVESKNEFEAAYTKAFPDVVITTHNKKADWKCRICNFINVYTDKRCIECGIKRFGFGQSYINIDAFYNDERKNSSFFTKDDYKIEISEESVREQYMIHGYCRDIEANLLEERVIPSSIIDLCFAFYINVK